MKGMGTCVLFSSAPTKKAAVVATEKFLDKASTGTGTVCVRSSWLICQYRCCFGGSVE